MFAPDPKHSNVHQVFDVKCFIIRIQQIHFIRFHPIAYRKYVVDSSYISVSIQTKIYLTIFHLFIRSGTHFRYINYTLKHFSFILLNPLFGSVLQFLGFKKYWPDESKISVENKQSTKTSKLKRSEAVPDIQFCIANAALFI